jgi:hypothetical protein
MTWQEAIEALREQRHVHAARYAELCADDGPLPWARESYRQRVIALATGEKREFPSLARQAANLAGAMGRAAVATVTGEQVWCTPDQESERESICFYCDKLVGGRCILCGCEYRKKIRIATERCPIGRWEKIKAS